MWEGKSGEWEMMDDGDSHKAKSRNLIILSFCRIVCCNSTNKNTFYSKNWGNNNPPWLPTRETPDKTPFGYIWSLHLYWGRAHGTWMKKLVGKLYFSCSILPCCVMSTHKSCRLQTSSPQTSSPNQTKPPHLVLLTERYCKLLLESNYCDNV